VNDISIDLETLGTRYDAPIVSIGAQVFDRNTGALGKSIYLPIDIESSLFFGKVDAATLKYWMQQPDSVRAIFNSPTYVHIHIALIQLTDLIKETGPEVRVWGNGATFDITILEHSYSKGFINPPWEFRFIRDMRTLVETAKEFGFDKKQIPFEGVPHTALDDAKHQAKVIAHCWQLVTGRTNE